MARIESEVTRVSLKHDDESLVVFLPNGKSVEVFADGIVQFWDYAPDGAGYVGEVAYPTKPLSEV